MNKIKLPIAALVAMAGIAVVVPQVATVSAAPCSGSATDCIKGGVGKVGGEENKTPLEDNIRWITNLLLFVLGAIAVIMIIIGGIRYTTSNGDSAQTKAAKDTILYAVVGLVVAILAYAIVNFVINAFSSK